MSIEELNRRVERIRAMMLQPHGDPRQLHDEVQAAIDLMESHREHVPADLRDAVEALQAEVVEEFYDNLPV